MRFRKAVAALSLALYLSSCAGWQAVAEIQPRTIEKASTIRVVLKDDRTFVLGRASIAGDSIFGVEDVRSGWQRMQKRPVSLALSDIARVEVERINGGKTVASLIVGGLVFLGISLMAMGPVLGGNPQGSTYCC